MNPIEMIESARAIAHEAHDSIQQKRKYTGEPYWVHTDEVAGIIQGLPAGHIPSHINAIAAAHLHDVIEDVTHLNPKYDLFLIGNTFGKEVADLVVELTDVYTKEAWPDLNRAKRKRLERERIGIISNWGKTIKLADLISNSRSIVEHDPDFARVYIREKMDLLPYLIGGDETLMNQCSQQVIGAIIKLGLDIPTISASV